MIALAFVGALAGIAIGCVGVGGVIVVPILIYFGLMSVHQAIAAAMCGYILAGATGTYVYAKKGTLKLNGAGMLCVAAAPFAALGAVVASKLTSGSLTLVISALMIGSALQSVFFAPTESAARTLSAPQQLATGAGTGFLSSLTGTGGPAVLIPLLLIFDIPVISIIGLGQVIQLPIAISATMGNILTGQFSLFPSVVLGLGLSAGTLYGAHLAHVLDRKLLRKIVLALQVVVGTFLIVKTLY
jgi:uncharacterized protein